MAVLGTMAASPVQALDMQANTNILLSHSLCGPGRLHVVEAGCMVGVEIAP